MAVRRLAGLGALCLLPFGAATASGAADARPLTVFAAASLGDAFAALGAEFAASGAQPTFNFAGSSTLVRQIRDGAAADVFAAADDDAMRTLEDAGALAGPPRIFATNRLTIVVPAGNPRRIAGLADLAAADLALALAAPAVPAGRYALAAFDKAGMPAPPASQELDVRAVLHKVALGEADAGIVYVTDVGAGGGTAEAVAIPDAFNVVARYPIAVLRGAAAPAAAAAFVDFVLSDAGRHRLAAFGFRAP